MGAGSYLSFVGGTIMSVIIYTDGSFKDNTIGWAFVVVNQKKVVYTENGVIATPEPSLLKIRNIAGEMKAVMQAVSWAIHHSYGRVLIRHDYIGLSHWIHGKWKTKNQHTKQYKDWMLSEPVQILFHHVPGHSGNEYNDLADKLAKEAIDNA